MTETEYLKTPAASEYLALRGVRVAVATFNTWRVTHPDRIKATRIGGRVYYRRTELDRFLGLAEDPTDARVAV